MRTKDVLAGIAVGDAVGNPLEFLSPVPVAAFNRSWGAPSIRVSDDTQMTFFLYEALKKLDLSKPFSFRETVEEAYLQWLKTQTGYSTKTERRDKLLDFPEMYHIEAPGRTCMSALRSLHHGIPVVNSSKGNGTVMRVAPVALVGMDADLSLWDLFGLAYTDAHLTHKHPFAALSSMALVGIYYFLSHDYDLASSVDKVLACKEIDEYPCGPLTGSQVAHLLHEAVHAPERLLSRRLGGWVAEEALALAVMSVGNGATFKEVVMTATCIDGDSDTVGGIAGGLAAAVGLLPPAHRVNAINCKAAYDYLIAL